MEIYSKNVDTFKLESQMIFINQNVETVFSLLFVNLS